MPDWDGGAFFVLSVPHVSKGVCVPWGGVGRGSPSAEMTGTLWHGLAVCVWEQGALWEAVLLVGSQQTWLPCPRPLRLACFVDDRARIKFSPLEQGPFSDVFQAWLIPVSCPTLTLGSTTLPLPT